MEHAEYSPSDAFIKKWLILCEGDDDRSFFWNLLNVHNLAGDFQVRFPCSHKDPSGGRGKFANWLRSNLEMNASFRETVKAVLIVTDSDDDPNASFAEIQAGLRASRVLAVPSSIGTVAHMKGSPSIVIITVPSNAPGCLETLCLQSAWNKWNFQGALDDYITATPADQWPLSKQSKARLNALLAATCKPRPSAGLGNHWKEHEQYHIPLNDPCFGQIVEFLSTFDALLCAGA